MIDPGLVVAFALISLLIGWAVLRGKRRPRRSARQKRRAEIEADAPSLRREAQIASVRFVTGADVHADYRILVEKRWISVVAEAREDAERDLRWKAARLGANGVVRLKAIKRQERYQAGVGPRGNPYYRTREVTEWEGCAVAAVERRRRGWLRRFLGRREIKLAVIDGSNVLHAAGRGPDLASVRAVVGSLKKGGWTPHLFFDANVGYKVFRRHASDRELASAIGLRAGQVSVVPGGRQADPYVMDYARRNRGVIVSNDLFRDRPEMMQGLPRLSVTFEGNDVRIS